jgi:hypothetical protein
MTTLQKVSRIMIAMAILFGLIALFLVGLFILRQLDLLSEAVATAWGIGFVLAISAGSIAFFWYLVRVLNPPAYRQARAEGVPATATVLDIQATGARLRRRGKIILNPAARPANEYRLRVLVSGPDTAPYEATLVEMIEPAKAPRARDTIAVKVHPQHPGVVVLDKVPERFAGM